MHIYLFLFLQYLSFKHFKMSKTFRFFFMLYENVYYIVSIRQVKSGRQLFVNFNVND